jgi:ATP-dependent Lhr-like helicase
MLPLDVLAQHVVSIASGGGFVERELRDEVRTTHAFANMTEEQWQWVIDFAERGGPSLTAYPRFARIKPSDDGRWVVASDQLARMHRMNIGTIAADGSVAVRFVGGKTVGAVEESFAAKLRPGDTFMLAGRALEFVRMHEMTAQVRRARKKSSLVPQWMGGRLPMSSCLAESFRLRLSEAKRGVFVDAEMQHVRPILEVQTRWSKIPAANEILVETVATRDGFHAYIFPFQGRLVHEGLAALVILRLARSGFAPMTATFNDYGIELLSPNPMVLRSQDWSRLLSTSDLAEDVLACVNSGELTKRHFREIARVAGLLVPARPGARRSLRQLQASSGLFFDVFCEFDPESLLLEQARREVLERQLEFARLRNALEQIAREQFLLIDAPRLTPLAFPLWAERIASQTLRHESAVQRIERLARELEQAANRDDQT